MDTSLAFLLCFYGSFPLFAVVAFALWACVRAAGKADDKNKDGD